MNSTDVLCTESHKRFLAHYGILHMNISMEMAENVFSVELSIFGYFTKFYCIFFILMQFIHNIQAYSKRME